MACIDEVKCDVSAVISTPQISINLMQQTVVIYGHQILEIVPMVVIVLGGCQNFLVQNEAIWLGVVKLGAANDRKKAI